MMSCSSLVIGRYCNSSPVWMRGHVGGADSSQPTAVTPVMLLQWPATGATAASWTATTARRRSSGPAPTTGRGPRNHRKVKPSLHHFTISSNSPRTPCFGSLYVTSLRQNIYIFVLPESWCLQGFQFLFQSRIYLTMFSTFRRDTFIHLPIQFGDYISHQRKSLWWSIRCRNNQFYSVKV